ncbi:NADH-quinone oxidoreductase subunit J [Luteimonas sp. SDU101]|uniref:NADH-quinone oxidoreductase subunit J n=1 Tax=Luteimonas sp. SDU101 TaxID=3422593 RepID=UPI003EC14E84
MDFALLAFLAFATVAVVSAGAVISVRNPVHAALFLVLTFFTVACTWILAGAEFLGVALILVYVGAVMVLFLFVVMMLDIDVVPLREGYVRYLPVGLLVAVVMLVEILTLIGIKSRLAPFGADAVDAVGANNVSWIARRLFTDFLLPFEVAALILTVAVVAAVTLTLRRRPGAKHQNPGEQTRTRAADRLRMVSMPAERPVVEAPAGNPAGSEGEAR